MSDEGEKDTRINIKVSEETRDLLRTVSSMYWLRRKEKKSQDMLIYEALMLLKEKLVEKKD